MKKRKEKVARCKYYTLSFTYSFQGPDTVYFAHCFPYTYTQLQTYLTALEADRRVTSFLRRKLLCYTLANNRCDMLTISSPSTSHAEMMRRPVIVVSARVHPGETNASYMMEGFLRFVTSEDPIAQLLRDTFVFKVVPMLNPDGVIHGNYRCSLAGVDLNRKYNNPDPLLHPTVHAMKNVLLSSQKDRGIFLYLDLHGHSQNKNTFLYGCDPLQSNIRRVVEGTNTLGRGEIVNYSIFPRIFPKVLVAASNLFSTDKANKNKSKSKKVYSSMKVSSSAAPKAELSAAGQFSFRDCSLKVQKSKQGTGRVVSWSDVGINASYTIEISFCGSGNNRERKLIKNYGLNRLKSLNGGEESTVAVNEELRSILKTYQTVKHYSQECLYDLGTQMCLAMASYGNINLAVKRGADCFSQDDEDHDDDHDHVDHDDDKDNDSGAVNSMRNFPPLYEIISVDDLHQPILHSSVISDKVITFINGNESLFKSNSFSGKGSSDNLRIQVETALRKCIRVVGVADDKVPHASDDKEVERDEGKSNEDSGTKLSAKGHKKKSKKKTVAEEAVVKYALSFKMTPGEEEFDDAFDDADDCGSDSDPSGDEASPLTLSKSKTFLSLSSLNKNKILSQRKNGKMSKKRRVKQIRKDKDKAASAASSASTSTLVDELAVKEQQHKPKGRIIAESALLSPNTTAYNQTISTSARRSIVRSRRVSGSGELASRRVSQSYHNFQDLHSPRTDGGSSARTSRGNSQAGLGQQSASSPHLVRNTSFDQMAPPRSSAAAGSAHTRLAKPRNIASPLPTDNDSGSNHATPREDCMTEPEPRSPRSRPLSSSTPISVIEAVRNYAAADQSPRERERERDMAAFGGITAVGMDKGVACKSTNKSSRDRSSSQPVPPSAPFSSGSGSASGITSAPPISGASSSQQKAPVFPPPLSPSPTKPHALMSSASKRLLMRSSELETLSRLANMDLLDTDR